MCVYKKLNAVRLALHSMELKKTGYNSFGKWHYFELADFLVPALKLFEEHGLCGIVSSNDATMRLDVREIEGDGSVTFAIPLSSAELKGAHAIQNLGAVITYSRRYLWTLALEILEHDAVDAAEPKGDSEDLALAKEYASDVVAAFNEGNDDAAYKEDNSARARGNEFYLLYWNELKPHSAVRAKLKKHFDESLKKAA